MRDEALEKREERVERGVQCTAFEEGFKVCQGEVRQVLGLLIMIGPVLGGRIELDDRDSARYFGGCTCGE